MPEYDAVPRTAPSPRSIQAQQVGQLFRLRIAPDAPAPRVLPGAAYFIPDDTDQSYIGAQIAAELGFDGTSDLVFKVRNYSKRHQVTVAIPADTVKIIDNVAKFHPRYFKVGGKQISARFDGKKTQSGNLELRHKHSTFACLTF